MSQIQECDLNYEFSQEFNNLKIQSEIEDNGLAECIAIQRGLEKEVDISNTSVKVNLSNNSVIQNEYQTDTFLGLRTPNNPPKWESDSTFASSSSNEVERCSKKYETDQSVLRERQERINFIKSTEVYKSYLKEVLKDTHNSSFHVSTPNKYSKCSPRSWNNRINTWRKKLHDWPRRKKNIAYHIKTDDKNENLYKNSCKTSNDHCCKYNSLHFNSDTNKETDHNTTCFNKYWNITDACLDMEMPKDSLKGEKDISKPSTMNHSYKEDKVKEFETVQDVPTRLHEWNLKSNDGYDENESNNWNTPASLERHCVSYELHSNPGANRGTCSKIAVCPNELWNINDAFPDSDILKSSGPWEKDSRLSSASNSYNEDKASKLETNPDVLRRRQKQIDYGKNTKAYKAYLKAIPKRKRDRNLHIFTPKKHLQYSRRSWDNQIKIWRKKLHEWDSESDDDNDKDGTDWGAPGPEKNVEGHSGKNVHFQSNPGTVKGTDSKLTICSNELWNIADERPDLEIQESLIESLKTSTSAKSDQAKILETDTDVLRRRQIQIDYGKNTNEYKAYLEAIPKEKRVRYLHISTPKKQMVCSRRAWDIHMKTWRKRLHEWDPESDDDNDKNETDWNAPGPDKNVEGHSGKHAHFQSNPGTTRETDSEHNELWNIVEERPDLEIRESLTERGKYRKSLKKSILPKIHQAKKFAVDEDVLKRRQKQIDYGKNTKGYKAYLEAVPKDKRDGHLHIFTPKKEIMCSRRRWDMQIKKWKTRLHEWDLISDDVNRNVPDFEESMKKHFSIYDVHAELQNGLSEEFNNFTKYEKELNLQTGATENMNQESCPVNTDLKRQTNSQHGNDLVEFPNASSAGPVDFNKLLSEINWESDGTSSSWSD